MTDIPAHPAASRVDSTSLYTVSNADPYGELVDRTGLGADDLAQVDRIMEEMGRLREVERTIALAAQEYMRLNQTDMRALHYLIIAENRGATVTPTDLSRHLQITTASTTKLLDRLEREGHVVRQRHPSDRRALTILVTPTTRRAATVTIGRQQASRYSAAARLTQDQRETVIAFLRQTADDLAAAAADPPPEPRA